MSLRVHVYGGKWLSTSTINEQTLGVARLQGPKRGSRHANSDNLEKIMREWGQVKLNRVVEDRTDVLGRKTTRQVPRIFENPRQTIIRGLSPSCED